MKPVLNWVLAKIHYIGIFMLSALAFQSSNLMKEKWNLSQAAVQLQAEINREQVRLVNLTSVTNLVQSAALFQKKEYLQTLKTSADLDSLVQRKDFSLQQNLLSLESHFGDRTQMKTKLVEILNILNSQISELDQKIAPQIQQMGQTQVRLSKLEVQSLSLNIFTLCAFIFFLWILAYQSKTKEKMHKTLKASDRLHRLIFSSQVDGIFLCTSEGVIITHNQTGQNLVSSRHSLTSQTYLSGLYFEALLPRIEDETGAVIAKPADLIGRLFRARKQGFSLNIAIPTKAVGKRHLNLTSRPLLDDDFQETDSVLIIVKDITDKVNQQKMIDEQRVEIMNKTKLSALGEIATGLAHEINNPLAYMMVESEDLQYRLSKNQEFKKEEVLSFTEKISSTVGLVAKIIKGMRTFARDGENDDVEDYSFQAIVDDTTAILQHRLKEEMIELRLNFEPGLQIRCRPTQIVQVLVNLMGNAIDALKSTEEAHRWIEVSVVSSPNIFEMVVTNSGPKVPASVSDRFFQAFFTTKEVGRGTGLGLVISRNIAKSHGGDLKFDPGFPNTRFRLILPQEAQQAPAAA